MSSNRALLLHEMRKSKEQRQKILEQRSISSTSLPSLDHQESFKHANGSEQKQHTSSDTKVLNRSNSMNVSRISYVDVQGSRKKADRSRGSRRSIPAWHLSTFVINSSSSVVSEVKTQEVSLFRKVTDLGLMLSISMMSKFWHDLFPVEILATWQRCKYRQKAFKEVLLSCFYNKYQDLVSEHIGKYQEACIRGKITDSDIRYRWVFEIRFHVTWFDLDICMYWVRCCTWLIIV